jgi:PST family polysaccharide transporter
MRIAGLLLRADLSFFILIYAADYLIGSLFLYFQAQKEGLGLSQLSYPISRMKLYMKEVAVIILATTLTAYYMRIDKVLVLQYHTSYDLGIYSAVTKLSEIWFFIPAAIAAVYAPILAKRSTEKEQYLNTLKKQTAFILYSTYAICLFTLIFAKPIILILFGHDYLDAVAPLRVHIWSLIFVALGISQMAWSSIERQQTLYLVRAFLGVVISYGLYMLYIPTQSIMGAAIATLIAYSFPGFFLNFFFKGTRELFFIQLSLLVPTPKNIRLVLS